MNAPVVIENQNCYANCFRMKQNIWRGNEEIIFSDKYEHSRPLSDSAINLAAYLLAWLESGDTTLAMALSHGDRLAHGVTASHVGKRFNVVYLYLKALVVGYATLVWVCQTVIKTALMQIINDVITP